MLAVYVNLYAMVSIRHVETGQSEQVYTHRPIDVDALSYSREADIGRIIGPYATLYVCYVNSCTVDFTRCPVVHGLDSQSEFTRVVLRVSM